MSGTIKTLVCILIVVFICGLVAWGFITKSVIAQVKTIAVSKISVSQTSTNGSGQGKYSITLQCSLDVDGTPEYTFSVSEDYLMGSSISALYQSFEDAMQEQIDKYSAEQVIHNHTQLDNIVSTLETSLSW